MDAEQAPRNASEALFTVFANYAKPPTEACIDTCGGPIPEAAARAAWQKSLREYTDVEVGDFGLHSLCLIVGNEGWREPFRLRLKYWIPRFLPGLANNLVGPGVIDDCFIIESFQRAGWPDWPDYEVAAVHNWMSAWLEACLTYVFPRFRPGDMDYFLKRLSRSAEKSIDFAIALGLDPTPQLYAATANLTPVTARSIASIVESYVGELIAWQELENPKSPGVLLRRELLRWLLHRSTAERLEQSYFKFAEKHAEAAAEISAALDWLINLRTSYAKSPQGWPDWLAK